MKYFLNKKSLDAFPIIIILIVAITIISGFLTPIYSDEIAIHMSKARFFLDDFHVLGLFPQCTASWERQPSWFQYPGAMLYSIIYPIDNNIFLRFSGVSITLLWFYCLWYLCSRLIPEKFLQIWVYAFFLIICAIGPLPYVMVLARSEQVLIICLIILCLLTLFWRPSLDDKKSIFLIKWLLFFIIVSLFYFAHPKAIFYVPFILIALYFFMKNAKFWQIISSLALFGFITVQTFMVGRLSTQCPEAPGVATLLAKNITDISIWQSQPFVVAKGLLSNAVAASGKIINRLLFESNYQSDWLPRISESTSLSIMNFVNQINMILAYFFLYFGCLIVITFTLFKIYHRLNIKCLLLSLSLLIGLVANIIFVSPNSWHFYTPGLVVPIFVLSIFLIIPDFVSAFKSRPMLLKLTMLPFYTCAILSMSFLISSTTPQMFNIVKSGDWIIKDQMISYPIRINSQASLTMRNLMHQCHINDKSKRIAVDGVAYSFMFQKNEPINLLYVSIAYGMDISDLGKFLFDLGSDGILSRCDYLPKPLINRSIKDGEICCVPREKLFDQFN